MDQVQFKSGARKSVSSRKAGPYRKIGLRQYVEGGVVKHTFDEHEGVRIESDVFLALCEAVNTPRSLAAWLLYASGEFEQLVRLELDPATYDGGSYSFEGDYLVTKFLSKNTSFNTGIDRESAAFDKWLSAEKGCRLVNDTFRMRWANESSWTHDVEEVYHLSRCLASRILGEVPSDILSYGGFGPGSDMSTSMNKLSRYYKYQFSGSGTPSLLSLVSDYVTDDRRDEYVNQMDLTCSSRLTFVPKTALIDRAICVEPRWNLFYQLSAGRVVQRRLLRFGVDITDQNRNRDLAGRAMKDQLATVDLSSASDTISTNLVLDMLPEDWSDLFLRLRSPYTQYKGERYRLEKISSMGNGYTFPLETLIFHCLAKSVCKYLELDDESVSVYGDDIIIPSAAYDLLMRVLTELGFSVNTKKSFKEGRFFESCGADYFDGRNVRPIFLKERICNVTGAIRLANQIVEFARRSTNYRDFDSRFNRARQAVIDRVPKPLRLLGPLNAGDAVFHAPFDQCTPPRAGNGWEGYQVLGFVPLARQHDARGDSLLFAKLDGADAPGNNVTHRGDTFLTVRKVYVHRYEDYLISE